jgi:hypothetical protein
MRALKMPQGVHQLNQVHTHLRNPIFQPQIPHHTHYNTGGCPYYGSGQSSQRLIGPFTKDQHNS